MLGYHVFFSVRNSKSGYTSTEFYSFEKDAMERALQLSVASNVVLITVRTVEIKSINLEVIKGNLEN